MSEMVPAVLLVETDRGYSSLVADNLSSRGFAVDQAASGVEALAVARSKNFDILVSDVTLGQGPTGMEVASELHSTNPRLGVVFLTNVKEPRYIPGTSKFKVGNASYLHKERLIDPTFLSTVITYHLHNRGKSKYRDDLTGQSRLSGLTDIQIDMLRLMAVGFGNPEIAVRRNTSVRAVETMQTRIYDALGLAGGNRVANRAKAIGFYLAEAGFCRGFEMGD